jgi:hypothetical protein
MEALAVYDLDRAPVNHDVLQFVLMAERARRRSTRSRLHVVFVRGANRDFADKWYGRDEQEWRIQRMAIPMARMVGASVSYLQDRDALDDLLTRHEKVFPPGYRPEDPTYAYKLGPLIQGVRSGEDLRYLVPHPSSEALVNAALRDIKRPLVTITQRNSWLPAKNAKPDSWARLTRYIKASGATVINVPDTIDAIASDGPAIAAVAAYDPDIRLALYRASTLNLMVNNGPMLYCMFGDAPFVIFKMTQPNVPGVDMPYMLEMGLHPQWEWPHGYGRFVFEPDDFEVLAREYDRAMATLLKQTASGSDTTAAP